MRTVKLTNQRYVTALYALTAGSIERSVDIGVSWQPLMRPPGTLRRVSFVTPSIGFVVGSGGVFRTTDGAQTWTQVDATNAYDVSMVDSSIGYFVGASGVCKKTIDGGVTWTAETMTDISGTPTLYGVDAIRAASDGKVYAMVVGAVGGDSIAAVWTWFDDSFWYKYSGTGAADLYAVAIADFGSGSYQRGAAVGNATSQYVNAGAWAAGAGMSGADSQHVVACGINSAARLGGGVASNLMRSTDYGANWAAVSAFGVDLRALAQSKAEPTTVYAFGPAQVMVTKDSGGSWANIGAPPAGAASVVDAALTAGHLNIGPATILHDHPIKRADPYYTDLVYTWGERGPASCSFRIGGETLNAYRDPPEGCVRDYWVEVYDEDVLVWDGQIASAKGIAG